MRSSRGQSSGTSVHGVSARVWRDVGGIAANASGVPTRPAPQARYDGTLERQTFVYSYTQSGGVPGAWDAGPDASFRSNSRTRASPSNVRRSPQRWFQAGACGCWRSDCRNRQASGVMSGYRSASVSACMSFPSVARGRFFRFLLLHGFTDPPGALLGLLRFRRNFLALDRVQRGQPIRRFVGRLAGRSQVEILEAEPDQFLATIGIGDECGRRNDRRDTRQRRRQQLEQAVRRQPAVREPRIVQEPSGDEDDLKGIGRGGE